MQPAVHSGKTCGGVTHGTAFNQLRRQNQAVYRRAWIGRSGSFNQAAASCWCDDLRDSSFSTAFIITDGVVSALSLDTVR